eukprot:12900329-Alexandrium_andersonii.AAC.1
MSASLVGSEMCIRDRCHAVRAQHRFARQRARGSGSCEPSLCSAPSRARHRPPAHYGGIIGLKRGVSA